MKLKEWGLLAAAMGLALTTAEVALRQFADPPQYLMTAQIRERAADSTARPNPASLTVTRTPEGGWKGGLYLATPSGKRLRPNVEGLIRSHYLSHRDVKLRTNSLGFRGAEIDWTRRPRVLFLGDSITLGDYLDESDTFVERVRTLSRGRWETMNAGVGSIGIDTELAILKEQGPVAKPDWVVLDLYLNDVEPSPAVELIQPPRVVRSLWLGQYAFQAASAVRYLLSRGGDAGVSEGQWRAWRQEIEERFPPGGGDPKRDRGAFNRLVLENYKGWGSAWSADARARLLETLDRMKAVSDGLGARFFVALHPVSFQVEAEFSADEPQRELRSRLAARSIPHVDLLPTLQRSRIVSEEPLFYDPCHHTPHGAAVVAQAIYDLLESTEGNFAE